MEMRVGGFWHMDGDTVPSEFGKDNPTVVFGDLWPAQGRPPTTSSAMNA
jgi:hypothetical protein